MPMTSDLDERVLRLISKQPLQDFVIAARLGKTKSAIGKAVARMRARGVNIENTEDGYAARSL